MTEALETANTEPMPVTGATSVVPPGNWTENVELYRPWSVRFFAPMKTTSENRPVVSRRVSPLAAAATAPVRVA